MTIINSVSILVLSALIGVSAGATAAKGTTMDEKMKNMVASAAEKENGWSADEVRIDEMDWLRRPSCTFYTAGNKVRPLAYLRNFAVVGGQVVGAGDGKVVANIVDSCAGDASA